MLGRKCRGEGKHRNCSNLQVKPHTKETRMEKMRPEKTITIFLACTHNKTCKTAIHIFSANAMEWKSYNRGDSQNTSTIWKLFSKGIIGIQSSLLNIEWVVPKTSKNEQKKQNHFFQNFFLNKTMSQTCLNWPKFWSCVDNPGFFFRRRENNSRISEAK